MKYFRLILGLLLLLGNTHLIAQNDTIILKTKDLAENYSLESMFFDDSEAIATYLEKQSGDYNTLYRTCQKFAIGAQSMIDDFTHDYRNGRVWLDETHYIDDFDTVRHTLEQIIQKSKQLADHYQHLELLRQEEQQRIAREIENENRRKQQAELAQQAEVLQQQIIEQNRHISSICDGTGISDKTKLKELKDIYYSYLVIYNKYNTSTTQFTPALYNELSELNAFQNDLLENILGEQSYLKQIDKFKDDLKNATAKEFSDIYKSYTRIFRHPSVPANFTNLETYKQYKQQLKNIISVQQAYLQVIDTYKEINTKTNTIVDLYGKKYKESSNAYKTIANEMYVVPSFTTLKESEQFLARLHSFQEVQDIYIANFARLESINLNGDTIIQNCLKKHYDIVVSYRALVSSTNFVATFRTKKESESYSKQLDNFETLQSFYFDIVDLRNTIAQKDDTILNSKGAERVLITGYKLLKKGANTAPNFTTIEQGKQYIGQLNEIINMQNNCIYAIHNQEQIEKDKNDISIQGHTYSYLAKAYTKVAKTYDYLTPITSVKDLNSYIQNQKRHIVAQSIFKEAFLSQDASAINQRLKKVNDVDKIKLILNIK